MTFALVRRLVAGLIVFCGFQVQIVLAASPPLVFQAAQSGKETLDQGEGGGNPFASSLIELLGRQDLKLSAFPREIRSLTERKSNRFQTPDVPAGVQPGSWTFRPKAPGETRVALVMVISDYSGSDSAQSLPGSKHDASRIAAALAGVGFDVEIAIDPDLARVGDTLRLFAEHSATADVALIYTTGHGVEVDGNVYLLSGNYPVAQGAAALQSHATRLADISGAARARSLNLVFWGGCRNNPFRAP